MNLLKQKNKTKTLFLASSFCLTLGAMTANTTQAATVGFSAVVSQFDALLDGSSRTVVGLSKFDPSLGTLTAVNLSAVGDYSIELGSFGFVEDEFLAHTIAGSIAPQGSIQIGQSGVGVRFAVESLGAISFDCSGPGDAGASCIEELDDPLGVSGTYDANSANDSTSLFSRLELNDLLDLIVGTGDIDPGVIEFGIRAFTDDLMITDIDNFTLDSGVFLGGDYLLGPTTISLEYEFTPAEVPVPAAVWLFGSALIGLAGFKRKK